MLKLGLPCPDLVDDRLVEGPEEALAREGASEKDILSPKGFNTQTRGL